MVTPAANDLGSLLLGKTRSALLGLLLVRPDEEFHLRQVVRLSGAGLGAAQRDLALLVKAEIILRREVGNQVLYRANAGHAVYPELRGLVLKTVGAAGVLGAALRPLAGLIRLAFIFGSLAKGREQAASDIDVMVVGDVAFAELVRALAPAQRQLGRDVNPTVYTPSEFAAKLSAGHHFVSSVLNGPKVFLLGDQHELAGLAKERVAAAAPKLGIGSGRVAGRRRARS